MFHDTQIVISSFGMDHLISSLDMHITKAHRASFLFTVQVWCHHLDVGFKRYQTRYRWFSRLVDCLVCRSSCCCFGNGGLCFVVVVWFHFLTFDVYGKYCNTSVRVFRIYHTSHLFNPLGCETSWTWGGGWGEQNGSGQLRYPGGTKCFSLPLKMNKFSFHCFGSKEPTAAILSPKSFKAC